MMPSRSQSLDNFQAINFVSYQRNHTTACTFTQNLSEPTRTAPILPCTMAEPSGPPYPEPTPEPTPPGGVMPVKEHIDHHMVIGSIPQFIDWTCIEFRSIHDKVLRHIDSAMRQVNMAASRVRIWYRDTIGFAVVWVLVKENVARDWMALNRDIEIVVRDALREENAGFGLLRVAVLYRLLPPMPLAQPTT